MWLAEAPGDEAPYEKVTVGGRAFFRRQPDAQAAPQTPKRRRRYSDQFRDPVFEQREVIRKLRMIMAFREKNGDLDDTIDRWRACIAECVNVLRDEHDLPPAEVFRAFRLQRYGFAGEDFGAEPGDDAQSGDE